MRGLPAAPTPRRSLRSPHPHTQLASLARTPTLLAPLALSPAPLQNDLNWPRYILQGRLQVCDAKWPQLASQ